MSRGGSLVVRILVAETLRPDDLISLDQRDRKCRELLVLHFMENPGLECCNYCRVVRTRRDVGLIFCEDSSGEQERRYRAINQDPF